MPSTRLISSAILPALLSLAVIAVTPYNHSIAAPAAPKPPAAAPKPAQDARPPVLTSLPLEQAIAQATAEQRLLLVVLAPARQNQERWRSVFAQPRLAEWVRHHALAVMVSDQATVTRLTDAGLNPGPDADPLIFRDGLQVRLFGSGLPQKRSRLWSRRATPASIALLCKLDWTVQFLGRTSPVTPAPNAGWLARHGPGPHLQPPAYSPVTPPAALEQALAEFTADPVAFFARTAAAASSTSTPEAGLAAATSLVALWEATWLTPSSSQPSPHPLPANPAWRAACTVLLGNHLQLLAAKHPSARQQLLALRAASLASLNLRDEQALFAYLMLCRAAGEVDENFGFLDDALNDPDGRFMLTWSQRTAYAAILRHAHWQAPPPAERAAAVRAVAQLRQRLADERPDEASAEEFQRLTATRRFLLHVAAVRTYAALLAQGEDDRAAALLDAAQPQAAPDPDTAAALLLAAAFVGQPRQAQAGLAKALTTGDQPVLWRWAEPFIAKAAK